MSKHDGHFFNTFSVIIGTLVVVTLVILALARHIGLPFEDARAASDPVVAAAVANRVAPLGRVAVAGQDNALLAIKASSQAGAGPDANAAPALPTTPEATYQTVCSACHGAGIAGAPKVGDRAAWAARIAQGKGTLYEHALKGFQGKAGVMPAKGARADLPDDLVRRTVDYIVSKNQ